MIHMTSEILLRLPLISRPFCNWYIYSIQNVVNVKPIGI